MKEILLRVATSARPGGSERPPYSPGTILAILNERDFIKRNWGDNRYLYVRAIVPDDKVEGIESRRLKLDLAKLTTPAVVEKHAEVATIAADSHKEMTAQIIAHARDYDRQQRQYLAISERINPIDYQAYREKAIYGACKESIIDLIDAAKESMMHGWPLTKLEVFAVKMGKLDLDTISAMTAEYNWFRKMMLDDYAAAKVEADKVHVVNFDNPTDVSGSIIDAPEWEIPKPIAALGSEDIVILDTPLGDGGMTLPGAPPLIAPSGSNGLNELDPTYTVGDGKVYATIQAAVDAIPNNLLAGGVQTVEVYASAPSNTYTEAIDAVTGFSNASAVDYISFIAMVSHGGKVTAGVGILVSFSDTRAFLFYAYAYTRINGFKFTGTGAAFNILGIYLIGWGLACNNIIYNITQNVANSVRGIQIFRGGLVYNNVIYNLTGHAGQTTFGIETGTVYGAGSVGIYNNTVYNVATGATVAGIVFGDPAVVTNLTNNSVSNAVVDFLRHAGGVLGNTNINNSSSDATADDWGTDGNLINQNANTLAFTNLGVGTEDFHILYRSVLNSRGLNLASIFTDDYEAVTRLSTWDIGADQLAAYTYTTGLKGAANLSDVLDTVGINPDVKPCLLKIEFDLNNLNNNGDIFDIIIRTGVEGNLRTVLWKTFTSNGVDISIADKGIAAVIYKNRRLDVRALLIYAGEVAQVQLNRASATDRIVPMAWHVITEE